MNLHCRNRALSAILAVGLFVGCIICFLRYRVPESENTLASARVFGQTVVIDAGHGGEDGGAVSISGAVESAINLDIALRLDAIFGLYGVPVVLLRDSDVSLHDTNADTLREKKVSDLKNRVETIEALNDPVVISIHQNTYSSSRYHGAQVFYANGEKSLPLAQITQSVLKQALDPTNERQATAVPDSVYLMNHITCKAILVECGFLSNPQEDVLLQNPDYQKKIAAAIAGAYLNYQEGETLNAS